MGRWFILLIAMNIASENGIRISPWIWAITIASTCIGCLLVLAVKINEQVENNNER